MDHPVLKRIVPNSGADDIGDDAELVWIAAWCSPEKQMTVTERGKNRDRRGVFCFPRDFDDDCTHIARMLEGGRGRSERSCCPRPHA